MTDSPTTPEHTDQNQQTPPGWYPADDHLERYWSGSAWTDQTRPRANAAPAGAYTATATATQAPVAAKKKRRIFLWFFLAVQVLFIIWIIAGSHSGTDTSSCGSLTAKECSDAQNVGTGIGVILIVVFWFFVDAFLAVVYGVYRLARRPGRA